LRAAFTSSSYLHSAASWRENSEERNERVRWCGVRIEANHFFFIRLGEASELFHHIPLIWLNQCILDIRNIFPFKKPLGSVLAPQPNYGE
jgi:hypothetical protein